jgi:hypothetical protein
VNELLTSLDVRVFSNSMLASWGHRLYVLCNSWLPLQIERPFNVTAWSRARHCSTWKFPTDVLDCKDNYPIVCTLLTRQQFDHNSVELTTRINLGFFQTSEVSFDPYLSTCVDSNYLPGFGRGECFQPCGVHVETVCAADSNDVSTIMPIKNRWTGRDTLDTFNLLSI